MPRRSQHSHSHVLRQDYSGPPSYDPQFANLNSSGLETFAALGDLSLSSPTDVSAVGNTSFEHYHYQPAYAPNHPDYNQAYVQHYRRATDPSRHSGAHAQQLEAYWQSHATTAPEEYNTPLPSPPLLSANSLNLPPLVPPRQDHGQRILLSQNALYDYPAPPDIPYAESAESAASSNLSPPEDEGLPKGPLDEDKRRRNLAASARFRQKKKMREQQLEQQSKELCDRANELEERIAELEKENSFLKALLTEKETDMSSDQRRKFHDFAAAVERGEL